MVLIFSSGTNDGGGVKRGGVEERRGEERREEMLLKISCMLWQLAAADNHRLLELLRSGSCSSPVALQHDLTSRQDLDAPARPERRVLTIIPSDNQELSPRACTCSLYPSPTPPHTLLPESRAFALNRHTFIFGLWRREIPHAQNSDMFLEHLWIRQRPLLVRGGVISQQVLVLLLPELPKPAFPEVFVSFIEPVIAFE